MKKSQFSAWSLLIAALGLLSSGSHGGPVTRDVAKNSSASADITPEIADVFVPYQGERFSVFDWNLCKLMANKYKGNLLISPISVKLALVLLYEGAQDQSAHELAGVMHLPVGRWATREKFEVILRSLQPVFNEYKLDIGTRVYMDSGIETTQSYAATIKTFYGADIVPTNFQNSHAAATDINNWVSNVTHNRIEKMIEDEASIKDSVMLVLNAMYFKGSWHKNRFNPNDTRTGKFYEKPGKTVDVPFMNTVGNFYFSESLELDAKILRIPYVGHKFAMYFILPRTVGGIDELVKNINPFVLTRHIWLMQDLPVDVKIPKFKFDFTSHLESTLRELGIRDIFDNTATLTGIARAKRTSKRLVVSDVVQKAGIEVNERGTTAFAATEIQIGNKISDQEFRADHPFLFFIEDEITGTILHMGRMSNPLEKSSSTDAAITPTFPNRFSDEATEPTPTAAPGGVTNVERYNFFNVELLQAVNAEGNGNAIVAPLSVKAALTALLEGTGGRTRQELLSTLRLPLNVQEIRHAARESLKPFHDASSGTEISLATRLWVGRGIQVSIDYNNALVNYYDGNIRSVDFTDSTRSAAAINEWVRQATRNNIRAIIEPVLLSTEQRPGGREELYHAPSGEVAPTQPVTKTVTNGIRGWQTFCEKANVLADVEFGSLSRDTHLLLTSALYFKANWLNAFDENATRTRCFRVPNFGCQDVPMMENLFKYKYALIPALDAEVVEIPYADGRLSMLILLPRNEGIQSLHTLSRDLSYTPISVILGTLRETELLLAMPRFSIESKQDLRPALETMGIKDLFDLSANLSGILPGSTVRVSNVLHNAKIEVNEAGTVAAAVTGLTVVPLMGTTFQAFRIDRPFMFAIVDRPTFSILFAGRVVNPGQSTTVPLRSF